MENKENAGLWKTRHENAHIIRQFICSTSEAFYCSGILTHMSGSEFYLQQKIQQTLDKTFLLEFQEKSQRICTEALNYWFFFVSFPTVLFLDAKTTEIPGIFPNIPTFEQKICKMCSYLAKCLSEHNQPAYLQKVQDLSFILVQV